jgi:hypothetical protein
MLAMGGFGAGERIEASELPDVAAVSGGERKMAWSVRKTTRERMV